MNTEKRLIPLGCENRAGIEASLRKSEVGEITTRWNLDNFNNFKGMMSFQYGKDYLVCLRGFSESRFLRLQECSEKGYWEVVEVEKQDYPTIPRPREDELTGLAREFFLRGSEKVEYVMWNPLSWGDDQTLPTSTPGARR